MKAGKLKESVLKRSILKQLHKRNGDVAVASAVGADYGAINVQAELSMVMASDPVVVSGATAPGTAIVSACNNVACSGAVPTGVSVTILLPTATNEEELRGIMKDLDDACAACRVDIVSGHTEVTRAVSEPVIVATVVGAASQKEMLHNQNIRPGMDIVATKWVGMEGAFALVKENEEALRTRYAQPFIDKAKISRQMMSILPEAAVAVRSGACAMHDVSEGGIFGALWEMAECAGVGLEIDLKKIPIRQETIEICEFFDINPYKIVSSGCLLIASSDGNALVMELEKAGIPAVVIGKATDSNDRVLIHEDERRFLERN